MHISGTWRFLSLAVVGGILVALLFLGIAEGAPAAADLDQCGNGPLSSPLGCQTSGQWQNGNLNGNQAHYLEGQSVPYRMRLSGLSTGASTHTITIGWDTTKGGKHALDYLTSFDRTETTANPCAGVAGCSLAGTKDTFAIPADPAVTGLGVTPVAGNFTMFNGDITAVSAYTIYAGDYSGDSSTKITISFTATTANPVLAWGGHIATRLDWGQANSAVSIPGSPYHMRLVDLDGKRGSQDRSLSNDAVIFPATVTIVKHASPESSTSFGFTASSPLTPASFSLVDSSSSTDAQQSMGPVTAFGTYTITEGAVSGWAVDASSACTDTTSDSAISGGVATIRAAEGDTIVCTFNNVRQSGTLRVIKSVSNDNGDTAEASSFTIHVKDSSGTDVTGSPAAGSATGTDYSLPTGTYTVSEDTPIAGYTQLTFTGDCDSATGVISVVAGETKTCTVRNDDDKAHPDASTTMSWTLDDSLALSGFRSDGSGGTVTFTLYLDDATCSDANALVFTSAAESVSNTGTASTSSGYTTSTSGTYRWIASYSGDSYNYADTTDCGDEVTTLP